jgi:hypothetical protein
MPFFCLRPPVRRVLQGNPILAGRSDQSWSTARLAPRPIWPRDVSAWCWPTGPQSGGQLWRPACRCVASEPAEEAPRAGQAEYGRVRPSDLAQPAPHCPNVQPTPSRGQQRSSNSNLGGMDYRSAPAMLQRQTGAKATGETARAGWFGGEGPPRGENRCRTQLSEESVDNGCCDRSDAR